MKNSLSKEQKRFIEDNYKNITSNELTEMLNEKFNSKIPVRKIQDYKKKHGLKNGVVTRFKKSIQPHNHKPVGSEFINNEGYVMIKVAEPNKWILKHRHLYEKYKGKIPNDYSVIFANGNKQDFDLDNLVLVERKVKLIAKNKKLFFADKKLTETGILIAKLISKTSERKSKIYESK